MRSAIQRSSLQAMVERLHAPEMHLPTAKGKGVNRSFLLLLAMVAALGLAPVVVAMLASSMLR